MSRNIKLLLLTHLMSGFICWYAIEKVFLTSINISIFQISILAVAYIATSASFNLPAGILADKKGRKLALIISAIFLTSATITGSMAHNFWEYLIAGILWGLFHAFFNGAHEAMLYDTLVDEGKKDKYTKIKGLNDAMFWVGIFLSSLIGAWVGEKYGLRQVFYITLIPNLAFLLLCLSLKEPAHHKNSDKTANITLAKSGFRHLLSSRKIFLLAIISLVLAAFQWAFNEFDQLFYLTLGLSVLTIGIANAFSGFSQGFGAFLGDKIDKNLKYIVAMPLVFVLFTIVFVLPSNLRMLSVVLLLLFMLVISGLVVANNAQLHHAVPSKIRATTFSALNMLSELVLIIAFLSFGFVSRISNARIGFFVFAFYGLILLLAGWLLSKKMPENSDLA